MRHSYSLFGVFLYFIFLLSSQPVHALELKMPDKEEAPNVYDYFKKNVDPKVDEVVRSVEKNHLKKFWEPYAYQRWEHAFGELKFILGYLPNHPKALMLMGSIAQITQNPSLGIRYYQKGS